MGSNASLPAQVAQRVIDSELLEQDRTVRYKGQTFSLLLSAQNETDRFCLLQDVIFERREMFEQLVKKLLPVDDVSTYVRMRCDAAHFDELGDSIPVLPQEFRYQSFCYLGDEASYDVDAPERGKTLKFLFTQREVRDAIDLAISHPRLALSLLYFRELIHDFATSVLCELLQRTEVPEDIEYVLQQWQQKSMMDALLPALSFFLHKQRKSCSDRDTWQPLVAQRMIEQMMQFLVDKHAFSSEHVFHRKTAPEKVERNKIACGAYVFLDETIVNRQLLQHVFAAVERHQEIEPVPHDAACISAAFKTIQARWE